MCIRDRLLDLIDGQTNPTIATYAKTAEVHIRITARAADYEEGKALVAPVIREIKSRFGNCLLYTSKRNFRLYLQAAQVWKLLKLLKS